ncbi:hypothetical protein [Hydrogenophaga sp.]|uniref:hypothetical protein n=1 Tax=Hydrogenophaga sp. TaxID=1904254 RepID=UPI003F71CF65
MSSPTLNRWFLIFAFVLGLAAIAWVGVGFVGTGGIALAMTALIGAVYMIGAQEIRRFRAVTASLAQALANVPQPLEQLGDWLVHVPPALQNAVRQRIEGERGALPGLALTPYLIGLLVMLGMLGTFLGMVVTFKGVVFTLEGSADLQAIRSALAAPIKGLGLAFGTSVVGVATSAMLGLMSAVSRRERQDVARQLDALAATTLRPFSLAHQRQEAFKALQQQAGALPAVANQLSTLIEQMERRSQQLDEQLLARQAQFHQEAAQAYSGLARSVEQSLKDNLAASARAAGESLQPVVSNAMSAIAQDTTRLHERVSDAVHTQMSGLTERLGRFTQDFEQRCATMVASVQDTVSRSHTAQTAADQQKQAAWTQALQGLATTLQSEWQQAGAQTVAQQQAAADQLAQTATLWRNELATLRAEESARGEALMQNLLQTAAEAPKAAAEVIAQLRHDMSQLTERDNRALQERAELMNQIDGLLKSVEAATGEQRSAIESLVGSASAVLDQVGRQFAETVGAQAVRAEDVATQVSGSAIELARLGEAFGEGVRLFSTTNEKLIASLQGIESAVSQSIARSDEQLAYYVAQAREVIDLSITSQQGILEDLRRLRSAEPTAKAEKKAIA